MAQIPLDLNQKISPSSQLDRWTQQDIIDFLSAIDNDQALIGTGDHHPGYVNVNGNDIFYNPAMNSSDFRIQRGVDEQGNPVYDYKLDTIFDNIEVLPQNYKFYDDEKVRKFAGRLNKWNLLNLFYRLGSQRINQLGLDYYRKNGKGPTYLGLIKQMPTDINAVYKKANSSNGGFGVNRAEGLNNEKDGFLYLNHDFSERDLSKVKDDTTNPYQAGDLKQYPPTTNAYGGYRGYRRYDDGGMMPPDQGMGGGSQVDQVLAMLSQLPPDQLQQVVQALMQMAQGGGMPQGDPSMMQDPSMGGMPPQGGMPPEGMMAYGGYNRYANGGNIQRTREQRLNYAFGGLINKYRK